MHKGTGKRGGAGGGKVKQKPILRSAQGAAVRQTAAAVDTQPQQKGGAEGSGDLRRSTTPRTGRHILALSASVVKACEAETPRAKGSGNVTWRTHSPQLTNRSRDFMFLSKDKPETSQASLVRATTLKKDRITAEREEAAALRQQKETLEKKNARRNTLMRAVLRSADGLYPKRCVNLL
jgi:hypothetical protein